MSPIAGTGLALASADNGAAERRKLRESAAEFEALLLGQLLRQARQAGDSEDNTQNPMHEFAEEHLARVLAQGGALGLAAVAESALVDQPRKARGEPFEPKSPAGSASSAPGT